MADADAFFDQLIEPHLASWNACIAGHSTEGNGTMSLRMFEKSKLEAIKPDGVTFTSAISACAHAGFVSEGLDYFASMSRDHGLLPQVKHYGAMLDLLARIGSFERVENLLTKMAVKADKVIWLCLLGACHAHRNVELATHAFDCAVSLAPKHAAAYVLMSNIVGRGGMQM
jgi:pentatricopeptide repeat protein